ncbi:hypothetical protein RJ639_036237 [Escallonia herrerae]|uniref:UBC core domain-containing protein n=1 Tax=Escallonia herrerae TaxID=1293975 RepID=A0AA89B8K2_9ASTE|nr:hypothetical protein RJ639_036237 [Escallonia herrerae]
MCLRGNSKNDVQETHLNVDIGDIQDQQADILYDSWSPAMTVSSICISILSMLSSSTAKQRPEDNDRYVKNCRNGRSPKETRWWFHDDKV